MQLPQQVLDDLVSSNPIAKAEHEGRIAAGICRPCSVECGKV